MAVVDEMVVVLMEMSQEEIEDAGCKLQPSPRTAGN